PRAVAVVIDPIQSVKGKVVIDAFRLINPQTLMLGQEPRQTTSNVGHLNKPSIQALIHGLNRHYYSIAVGYLKGRGGGSGNGASSAVAGASNGQMGGEEAMLMNLHKSVWTEALEMPDFKAEGDRTLEKLNKLVSLAEGYEKRVKEETELTKDQLRTRYVGKVDPKKHIETLGQDLLEDNIVSVSRQMIDKEASVPSACRIEAVDDDADGMAVDQTA
ncbi:Mov34-domain-containing protein, partial [Aureobasidium melanogenum]